MKLPTPQRWDNMSALQRGMGTAVIRAMSTLHTAVYRVSGGRFGARFLDGQPLLLLFTRGRKTGKRRTHPLIFLEDGERLVIVASKGGYPKHPDWYGNLVANPDVEVQIGPRREARRARTALGDERSALWPRLVALYAPYADYQTITEREIPVVVLERTA